MCDDGSSEEADEEAEGFFNHLGVLSADSLRKRDLCETCRRPMTVCWCQYLPKPPLSVNTTVYILQHPFEERRTLKTAPMLYHGLEPGKCHIWKGKRFSPHKNVALKQLLQSSNTLLLYPGPSAVDLSDFVQAEAESGSTGPYNLILLDGTWPQARGLYSQNNFLHGLKQVKLDGNGCSKYVIRTQPTDSSLSTVESAAVCIAVLENRPEIPEMLVQPLKALCDYQIQHGAVKHHSKQYLQSIGLLTKQQPRIENTAKTAGRRRRRKMTRAETAAPKDSDTQPEAAMSRTNTSEDTDSVPSNVPVECSCSEKKRCQSSDERENADPAKHAQNKTDASDLPEEICNANSAANTSKS